MLAFSTFDFSVFESRAFGALECNKAESSVFANDNVLLLFGYGFVMLKTAKQSIKALGWKFRLFGLLFV